MNHFAGLVGEGGRSISRLHKHYPTFIYVFKKKILEKKIGKLLFCFYLCSALEEMIMDFFWSFFYIVLLVSFFYYVYFMFFFSSVVIRYFFIRCYSSVGRAKD